MFAKYVWRDLVRNPRRTISTLLGVTLGVGLMCSVLFFFDGLSASMTRRAVAPLSIDMQRVLTEPAAAELRLTQRVVAAPPGLSVTNRSRVELELRNIGLVAASEVVVRSTPKPGIAYRSQSAMLDNVPIGMGAQNPFSASLDQAGFNLGNVPAGATRSIRYEVESVVSRSSAASPIASSPLVNSTVSSRESSTPTPANSPVRLTAQEVAPKLRTIKGVAFAEPLSFADLEPGALRSGTNSISGAVKVFGFDPRYTSRDRSIRVQQGSQRPGAAMIGSDLAAAHHIGIGRTLVLTLPDSTQLTTRVSAIADLRDARSLFASRKGANFETFVYVPNSVVVDSDTFGRAIATAFDRAAAQRGHRLQSPPTNEVEVGVDRAILNAQPSAALRQTTAIAHAVNGVAAGQDFLIDNISNTLAVASGDADVAKRLFIFLGVPGGLLAGILAVYAGSVLAAAQRRELTTLLVRGATKRHLTAMLAFRVGTLALVGSVTGVLIGYGSTLAVLGRRALAEASTSSLVGSALLGASVGLVASGLALYVTGHSNVNQAVGASTVRVDGRPRWQRWYLDVIGAVLLTAATIIAIKRSAFDGTAGSVYSGQSVKLSLSLLGLPVAAWAIGGLVGARALRALARVAHGSRRANFEHPVRSLLRLSVVRRSAAVIQGAVALALIVALGTSISLFATSYADAKAVDARYSLGSDLRITPDPLTARHDRATESNSLKVPGVATVSPVVYGVHNVVVRSKRTEEVTNVAAIDPDTFAQVAPVDQAKFTTTDARTALKFLKDDPTALLMSTELADFIQADIESPIRALLARGTADQSTTKLHVVAIYDRLPGFPDGVGAVMNIHQYEKDVPSIKPDLFLAATAGGADRHRVAIELDRATQGQMHARTPTDVVDKEQSSLAALNIKGLLRLDSGFALAMAAVAIAVFVFGLLLARRREYVTLRAQGLSPRSIRALISAEAAAVAAAGSICGVALGIGVAYYFVKILRPLFTVGPQMSITLVAVVSIVAAVGVATAVTSLMGSSLVNRLRASELLRDE